MVRSGSICQTLLSERLITWRMGNSDRIEICLSWFLDRKKFSRLMMESGSNYNFCNLFQQMDRSLSTGHRTLVRTIKLSLPKLLLSKLMIIICLQGYPINRLIIPQSIPLSDKLIYPLVQLIQVFTAPRTLPSN